MMKPKNNQEMKRCQLKDTWIIPLDMAACHSSQSNVFQSFTLVTHYKKHTGPGTKTQSKFFFSCFFYSPLKINKRWFSTSIMNKRASTALYVGATKENQKIHYRPSLEKKKDLFWNCLHYVTCCKSAKGSCYSSTCLLVLPEKDGANFFWYHSCIRVQQCKRSIESDDVTQITCLHFDTHRHGNTVQ